MSDESFAPQPLPGWVKAALSSPDPKWLIEGAIPADGLTIISGRPKLSKKSWFAYLAGLAMSSGRTLGPLVPPAAVPVLYCNLEGAIKPTAERFPMLAKGHGLDLSECEQFYMLHNTPVLLDDPRSLAQLCHFVNDKKIQCVIIDTFARGFAGDENSSRDVGRAMAGVGKLRTCGASVVLVHHTRKVSNRDGGDIFDVSLALRGSSAIDGAMDQLIGIVSVPAEDQPGVFENWLSYGGKHLERTWYEQLWTIKDGDFARLELDGPKDVPSPEPAQRPRF
jgi:RecA-family ATPase